MPFTDVNDIRIDSTELFPEIFKFLAFHAARREAWENHVYIYMKEAGCCTFSAWKKFFFGYVCVQLCRNKFEVVLVGCLFPVTQDVSVLWKNIHSVLSENPFKSISNILNDFLNHILRWDICH